MPSMNPHAVRPEDYKIGDQVRWYVTDSTMSPYIGRIYAINPKTNKVMVTWPVGGNATHSPEELVLIPPELGISPITQPAPGYMTWEVAKSEKIFGKLTPATMSPAEIKKSASVLVTAYLEEEASKYAETCKQAGYNDVLVMDRVASVYSGLITNSALSAAVEKAFGTN